jgi:hypothetical protein
MAAMAAMFELFSVDYDYLANALTNRSYFSVAYWGD